MTSRQGWIAALLALAVLTACASLAPRPAVDAAVQQLA